MITDEMLIAYADGELGAADVLKVEAAIANDPVLAARLEAQLRLISRISEHYDPVAGEPVPDRFRKLLEPGAEIVDFSAAREARARRISLPSWGAAGGAAGAIAATLVAGFIAGNIFATSGVLVTTRGGAVVAAGKLDAVLGEQLASLQPAGADVLIGLSFRAKDGDVCRTFEASAMSGIACHADGHWQLRQTHSSDGNARPEYRQERSAEIAAAAAAMMAGEAFDATTERAARDAGWK